MSNGYINDSEKLYWDKHDFNLGRVADYHVL
jgi:hypothetical protein